VSRQCSKRYRAYTLFWQLHVVCNTLAKGGNMHTRRKLRALGKVPIHEYELNRKESVGRKETCRKGDAAHQDQID
jgi:hypothetical protein